jgi:large subunit ribosomal protein L18
MLNNNYQLRKNRVRAKISGTAQKPRLSVYKSNRVLYAQMIDDEKSHTLCSVSSIKEKKCNTKQAEILGKKLGELAKAKKIETCVFDKGAYRYHGVIKTLADSVRESGLKF